MSMTIVRAKPSATAPADAVGDVDSDDVNAGNDHDQVSSGVVFLADATVVPRL